MIDSGIIQTRTFDSGIIQTRDICNVLTLANWSVNAVLLLRWKFILFDSSSLLKYIVAAPEAVTLGVL